MKKTNLKLLLLGGIVGPVLFTTVTLICASLRPDYSHMQQFISELGATGTSNTELMNFAGFIPSGVFILLFGVSLMLLLPRSLLSLSGSTLIAIFGIGMIIVGVFSCDVGCPREGSFENNIHDLVSPPMFIMVIIGMLLLGISFRMNPVLRKLWVYSLVSALLSLFFMIALINSIGSYTYMGLWQRLLLATIFLWCVVVSVQIFKFNSNLIIDH